MKPETNSVERQYARLLDMQAEAIMMMSPEELDEDIRESGLDPQEFGEEARQAVARALGASNEQALARSRQIHRETVASLRRVYVSLPTTIEDKLDLLKACLEHHHYLKPAVLTGQHRKLSEMAPSDIDSLLHQLHVLGLLKFKKVSGGSSSKRVEE